jgi:alkanesulfonate monooxygenase SsuD/methylene tetrahydromethanopterin reductase-like flavin-dependent oxidoreductase (luciferase family)
MSAASPESGEFAARSRIGIGFAFTTIQIASKAADYYREQANHCGWTPTPENIIYRLGMHVAETDEEAIEDVVGAGGGQPSVGLSLTNKVLESVVAKSGYYGRDIETQRARLHSRGEIHDRIDKGQILVGSPDTVFKQAKRIRDVMGCGILDLSIAVQLGDKTMKSIEMFGTKVLPRLREL